MSMLRNFKDNALNSLRKPTARAMLYTSSILGLGIMAPTQKAQAQQIKAQYYIGYQDVTSDMFDKEAFNPYEERGMIVVGGRISLADTDNALGNVFGLVGEYRYQLADPNQISGSHNWSGFGQQHHVSYSRIPSRARLGVFATTPTDRRLQASADANLLAYPGGEHNLANSSHFMAGAELRLNLFKTESAVNLEAYTRAEYIAYNREFWNRYYLDGAPNSSTTFSAGIRLTLAPR